MVDLATCISFARSWPKRVKCRLLDRACLLLSQLLNSYIALPCLKTTRNGQSRFLVHALLFLGIGFVDVMLTLACLLEFPHVEVDMLHACDSTLRQGDSKRYQAMANRELLFSSCSVFLWKEMESIQVLRLCSAQAFLVYSGIDSSEVFLVLPP